MTTKILICYGTRHGTTTEIVAEMARVAEEAGAQVEAIELKKKLPKLNLIDYDLAIIGSSIQVGKWKKEPLKFIEENLSALSTMKTALFVVCGDAGTPEGCENAQANYLDAIVEMYPGFQPISTGLFGGMFDFKRYNFAMRAMLKRIVANQQPPGEKIPEVIDYRDWDQIRDWMLGLIQA
jgi:menaquinone-dependent protoporphyrinogen IX oxidase